MRKNPQTRKNRRKASQTVKTGRVRVCRRKEKGERSDEEILELDQE